MLNATLPRSHRWIAKGMTVTYRASHLEPGWF
jgi:hypothetical protein